MGRLPLPCLQGRGCCRYAREIGQAAGAPFPEIVALLRGVAAAQFVVDGEIVIALDGRLSFDALQMRLHPAESRIRKLAAETPARLVLFDMLAAPSGAVLTGEPLRWRRKALQAFMKTAAVPEKLVLSPFTSDRAKAERWLKAGTLGTDGVIAKHSDGIYAAGERAMVKVKLLRTADCVVGGFRYENTAGWSARCCLGSTMPRASSTMSASPRPSPTRSGQP
jgi:ATP-dependent DNA ligase